MHKKGVPHLAFRKNYMSQLRALLPLPAGPLTEGGSPDPGFSSVGNSPDAVGASSRPNSGQGDTESHRTGPPSHCRPQVFPGAIDVSGTELAEIRSMTRARVATAAPPERERHSGGGGGGFDLLGLICSELGVDPGTDCGAETFITDIASSIAGVGGCFAGAQNVSGGSRAGGFHVV